ncbi:nuclear protein localization protein 4 homolog isoform X1 [Cimex lectularius]|uniref:Nuclear protein localization protein 4 homolog n=1 Tax=Cimex lectularius TaxID=79782 RepID=A0A8I6TLI8_CIMLE|nr:nuclear protein localization protein 4 homolog isoform X1 [Cimex lectularius]
MSNLKNIVLRIQSSEGTIRINVSTDDTIKSVYVKVHDALSLKGFNFSLHRSRKFNDVLAFSKSATVQGKGLKHGDILYLQQQDEINCCDQNNDVQSTPGTSGSSSQSTPSGEPGFDPQEVTNNIHNTVVEDEVDQMLWKMDGHIYRQRDPKLCRHGTNACCVHCSSLEPYDEEYLKEHNIKHMSFHSYLRKLTGGVDRGKFLALENTTCRIKPGCKEHQPWPKGICSKCQPSAVTLNRQVYRHVDNVMFENPEIVERFLEYWRVSGHQRVGYLYGRYEVHSDVPLGIRAIVAVIYEPPQETSRDKVKLLPDERESLVNDIARMLGLVKVGWIFTDLIADDVQKGTVKHIRNIDTHFLSAQECIMAGHLQNLHPNPCKFSPTGYFGSKFATVCVTGDAKNQVHMEGYAVSSQCMSLVRDECLVPTKDLPQLGYVKESSDKMYVPDVYYKEKDTYGNEVSKLARPLPVEYLLVDVPVSTPLTPLHTFRSDPTKSPFPIENRLLDKHIQDFNALSSYIHQFSSDQFLTAVSDFHVLLYIATMEMLPMKDYLGPLLKAVKERDAVAAADWARSEHWATVEQLVASSQEGPTSMDTSAEWTCPHCTFLNLPHLQSCDMCSLPR